MSSADAVVVEELMLLLKRRKTILDRACVKKTVALTCLIAHLAGVAGLSARADDAQSSPQSTSWRPAFNYEDKKNQGDLELRIHPDSPRACGIDIIEVGTHKPGQDFDPHFALLRDRYDASYPGVAPKVRRLYAYNIRPTWTYQEEKDSHGGRRFIPISTGVSEVLNTDTAKRNILIKMTYDLAKIVMIAAGTLLSQAAVVTVDQFVDVFLKERDYHRTRALYTLQLMDEVKHPAMNGIITSDEIERLITIGREDGLSGLLLTEDYVKLIHQSEMDDRRSNRTRNFQNLLSAINREGLIAQPLFRDYVMVYYDPKRPTAHPIDRIHTDLSVAPEDQVLQSRSVLKNGLIPLGLYAIGDPADRLLAVDLNYLKKADDRAHIQNLVNLAAQYASAFIPFPFSLSIDATHAGTKFVLNKSGQNVLTEMLHTEAELAALLDSGVASLDPELLEQVRAGMGKETSNVFIKIDQNMPAYRAENARRMTEMLRTEGESLCSEIKRIREGEFRSEYLSASESVGRAFSRIWTWITFSDDTSYDEERRRTIQMLTPLVNARRTLRTYDPNTSTLPAETIIDALRTLGGARQPEDAEIIARVLKNNTDIDVLLSAIEAAATHRKGDLDDALVKFLSTFNFEDENTDTRGAIEALQAIIKIDISTADTPDDTYRHTERYLYKIKDSRNPRIAELAKQAITAIFQQVSDAREQRRLNNGGGENGA